MDAERIGELEAEIEVLLDDLMEAQEERDGAPEEASDAVNERDELQFELDQPMIELTQLREKLRT